MQRFLVLIFVLLATVSLTFAQDHNDHAHKAEQHATQVKEQVSTHIDLVQQDGAHLRNQAVQKAGVKTHVDHTTSSGTQQHGGQSTSSHSTQHLPAADATHSTSHNTTGHVTTTQHSVDDHGHGDAHGAHGHDEKFDVAETAMHHIGDANVYSILDWIRIPLPMILKSKDGWDFFMSNKFDIGHHEDGHKSYKGYLMHHGSVHKPVDASFPKDESVHVHHYTHEDVQIDGKEKRKYYAHTEKGKFEILPRTTLDAGVLGGGVTNFWDFSITKNVVAMFIVMGLLFFLFYKAAKRYRSNPDRAPKGLQGFLEPLVLFIRDEVAIPFLGKDKYMKYFPFLLSVFFFVLGLNLFGQIPFLGNVNASGNLSVTLVIALITFLVINISGNKEYWGHIFWNPDAPILVKLLLLPVEVMGIFIKPVTLMLRLAGNISAGHIAIVSFLGLIFILGENGKNMFGAGSGTVLGVGLTMFMSALELLVAFIQAFVFTLLSASYIGMAIEEHHHDDHH